MNQADAANLIASITDPEELYRLKEGETLHPQYQGGRKGVLALIDSRFGDIEEGKV
jgi:hypothetical protein